MTAREIAEHLGATLEGSGERLITAAAALEDAESTHVAFVANRKAAEAALQSPAGCLLVPPAYPATGQTLIRVDDPRAAFTRVVRLLHPEPAWVPGIHPTAVVAPSAQIHPDSQIGPHVTVGEETVVGPGTVIGPRCSLAQEVRVGQDCRFYAGATLYAGTTVGNRVILHAGVVLGADGFGYARALEGWERFPHIGRVLLGDDVEIGANSCVDRAALGVTVIADGTKLDNLVHVGHNCRLGKRVVVAAQTGFSGGVVVEDDAVIGGQVGVGDKARIERGAVLGSGSGVLTSKIVRGGQVLWGTPARPLREHLEQLAALSRLPKVLKELRQELAALRAGKALKE